ncbi:IS30 family transposase, partial [Corynebacterium sp. 13CS0277]
ALPTDQELLDMIANEINIRPRRCLDSWSPVEVFNKLLSDEQLA